MVPPWCVIVATGNLICRSRIRSATKFPKTVELSLVPCPAGPYRNCTGEAGTKNEPNRYFVPGPKNGQKNRPSHFKPEISVYTQRLSVCAHIYMSAPGYIFTYIHKAFDCVCAYMHVCAQIFMYIHTAFVCKYYTCMRVCIYLRIYTAFVCVCTDINMCVRMFKYTHTVFVCVCTYIHMCVYMFT